VLADIEYAAARLGIDPDDKELWQLGAAFGLHREEIDNLTALPGAVSMDSDLQQMINAELAHQHGGEAPQWPEARMN
jgi:hypothetical protein